MINNNPNDVTNPGIFVCYFIKSFATCFRDVNGESKIIAAILGSRSACIKAVTAPMLRPQRPMVLTFLEFLKFSITTYKSSLS